MTFRSVILGTGSALPKKRVSNDELAQRVDTSDEWIVARTGIRFRHIAGEGETTATLGAQAARHALEAAGIPADTVDLIILATATPDQTFPASATKIQALLGINDCVAFDVAAVCSGFLYAMNAIRAMACDQSLPMCMMIGLLFLMGLTDFSMAWMIVAVFMVALVLLAGALGAFVREISLATHAIKVRSEYLELPSSEDKG